MKNYESGVYHLDNLDQACDDPHLEAHSWTGRGRVQALQLNGALHLRVDALTSQTRRFKSLIGDFFRMELKRVRPKWGPYEVVIRIERTPQSPIHDVDNVAKAVLDALTGIVFHDDSQVERLYVEKVEGERARIQIRARPIKKAA